MIINLGCNNNKIEYMGLFGLTWPEKVISFMQARLKGTIHESKLKSFWSPGGKNTALAENLEREYLVLQAQGFNPVSFSLAPDSVGDGGQLSQDSQLLAQKIFGTTAVDISIINEFLRAIFVLARDGKIPYEKWNPKGFQESKKTIVETFDFEKSIIDKSLDKLKPASDTMRNLLIVAGVGVGAYLLSQLKSFVK